MAKVTVDVKDNQQVLIMDKGDVEALAELLQAFSAPSTILRSLNNRYALIVDPESVEKIATLHLRGFGAPVE